MSLLGKTFIIAVAAFGAGVLLVLIGGGVARIGLAIVEAIR